MPRHSAEHSRLSSRGTVHQRRRRRPRCASSRARSSFRLETLEAFAESRGGAHSARHRGAPEVSGAIRFIRQLRSENVLVALRGLHGDARAGPPRRRQARSYPLTSGMDARSCCIATRTLFSRNSAKIPSRRVSLQMASICRSMSCVSSSGQKALREPCWSLTQCPLPARHPDVTRSAT